MTMVDELARCNRLLDLSIVLVFGLEACELRIARERGVYDLPTRLLISSTSLPLSLPASTLD
jgi:hypothetical protein